MSLRHITDSSSTTSIITTTTTWLPSRDVNEARSGRGWGQAQEHEAEANSHDAEANSHEVEANSHKVEANSHKVEAKIALIYILTPFSPKKRNFQLIFNGT